MVTTAAAAVVDAAAITAARSCARGVAATTDCVTVRQSCGVTAAAAAALAARLQRLQPQPRLWLDGDVRVPGHNPGCWAIQGDGRRLPRLLLLLRGVAVATASSCARGVAAATDCVTVRQSCGVAAAAAAATTAPFDRGLSASSAGVAATAAAAGRNSRIVDNNHWRHC